MEDNDEDFFSDHGFDDLPPSTLFQLEQNAYLATQAPRPVQHSIANNLQIQVPDPQPIPSNATLRPPPRLHTGLTNDYNDLDVGELDAEVLEDDSEFAIALDKPPGLPGQAVHLPANHPSVTCDPFPESMEIEERLENPYQADIYEAYNVLNEKLMLEDERRKQLMEELAAAKSLAEAKAGEIAIIRSNQARLAANYDRQLAALRKAIAEETTKHKEEVEAVRVEGKLLATENAFLKQDLAEEALRINNLKAKERVEEKAPPVTPKKSRALPFRDGFDDDEIIAVSPSKSARSKRMTPVVPEKRKRKLSEDSPIPLQLSPRPEPVAEAHGDMSDDTMVDVAVDQHAPRGEDQDLQLMKCMLNHRSFPNEERDIEAMARLAFPSDPQRMLSTILLEETANLHSDKYLVDYVQAISSLWSRALEEKFFQPIPMFMEIIRYILVLGGPSCVPDMIEHLLPVLQNSGEVNAVVRFKHSPVSHPNRGQIRQTTLSQLQPQVNSTEAMGLLYQMACACLHIDSALENFWRHIRFDFILVMLNSSQPIRDLTLALNLLSTSVRPGSFGSIMDTEQRQMANENYIVDRVASLLSETLQVDEGQPPYIPSEICNLRLEAMSFLVSVAFNPIANDHGSLVIASHPTALVRLIRAMHDELDALYTYPPERELHASLVNGLMGLVYEVIRRHKEHVDLHSKLGRVPGGKQKFLVVLTRLAFSEGQLLEGGIEDETVEMAHEILDNAVNPQEAEALLEAFPSAKRDD